MKFVALAMRLLRHVEAAELRSAYRHQLRRVLRQRFAEPHILFIYSIKIAMHYHYDSLVGGSGGSVPEGLRSFSRGTSAAEAEAQRPAA